MWWVRMDHDFYDKRTCLSFYDAAGTWATIKWSMNCWGLMAWGPRRYSFLIPRRTHETLWYHLRVVHQHALSLIMKMDGKIMNTWCLDPSNHHHYQRRCRDRHQLLSWISCKESHLKWKSVFAQIRKGIRPEERWFQRIDENGFPVCPS